ncbi:MAG: 4-hydroxy-tetrahydrodipicolinate reductase [Candidatus Altiarchaeales archaeon]|nr:MAG: 4-hydroxy-tetrahydrodipicolinate reductase [Candidatus Altiarchaeales archaeon]
MTSIVMLGFGRMGREIVRRAIDENIDVLAVIERDDSEFIGRDLSGVLGIKDIDVEIFGSSNLSNVLKEKKPDVAVDFTNPEACVENSRIICDYGINLVIGTTGFSNAQMSELRSYIEKSNIGAVISPNMSIGVNVFWDIVGELTEKLSKHDYDIEIIEMHHRFKRDAPSGTAMETAKVIARKLNKELEEISIYGRKGLRERTGDEIGIHAIRAGDIVGEHTVLYGTIGERIEIRHVAHSRMAFVNGVIMAIEFIKDKRGIYGMDDVLGLRKKQ